MTKNRKKILLVSPVPTHPQNAGNRMRIFTLASCLIKLGHEIHFVHVEKETGDRQAMTAYWQDRYHPIIYKKPTKTLFQKSVSRIRSVFVKHLKHTYFIDEWYDPSITQKVLKLQNENNFDTVIVVYVFLSKLLKAFNKNVLKLIDTHDVFTDRHLRYLKNNERPNWFSTTARQEKKGLCRADRIIAIQDHEKDFFMKLVPKKVISVGHLLNLQSKSVTPGKNHILFIGSANPINIQAANSFILEVLPMVRNKIANTKLILAGNICDFIPEAESVIKLGEVNSLEKAYDMADLVINPVKYGTGLKIKTIEALSFSKPLVTTSTGAEGIENGAGKAFIIADSPAQFAAAIIDLFTKPDIYARYVSQARQYAEQANNRCIDDLIKVLA